MNLDLFRDLAAGAAAPEQYAGLLLLVGVFVAALASAELAEPKDRVTK